MFDIKENLKKLPDSPGVYIHKDRLGEVIYVGKAVSLRNRVRQYFQSQKNMDSKVSAMVSHIAEFEYITTATEMEALILECNLIKRYSPKYNILLRDDKTYPYIKITMKEDYPRILKTRRVENDGARYFGPYSDAGAVNRIVDLMGEIYRLKKCSAQRFPKGFRPCLNYHIEQCRGICTGYVSKDEYRETVNKVAEFLGGSTKSLVNEMKAKLEAAAEQLDFETAAKYRDNIMALEAINEKQRVVLRSDKDMDIILTLKGREDSFIVVFYVRDGKLSGRENFEMHTEGEESSGEMISSFIKQYYGELTSGPKEILTEEALSDANILSEYLSQLWGRKTSVFMPLKGEKKAILDLARKDVVEMAKTIDDRAEARAEREDSLRKQIDAVYSCLKNGPHGYRVEAYDISDINGVDSVGAMVVFDGSRRLKKDYRRFKVKTVEGPDDYGSMQEVLYRRFKRAQADDAAFNTYPDMLFIDGGKGHVAAANKVLRAMQIDIPAFGMAKDDSHRTKELVYEKDGEFSMIQIKDSPLLFKYVGNIQEEVHRFAIDYHRTLRTKNMLTSVLDEIEGIGPVKRNSLLAYFGSVDRIKAAAAEELVKVDGITEKNAQNILKYFRG
ncbi:MAG: excinuclease ABC subunit UvrC [Anaerovoracaceae bacterium]|nr:excinuclease ABC subunit UvrC [Anaerovoracaceae bacterium]